jgi:hypothetical protein
MNFNKNSFIVNKMKARTQSPIFKKIKNYCHGIWKPNKKDEQIFLSSNILKNTTGNKKSMNTGKLSEWYIRQILKDKKIIFQEQPRIKYQIENKSRYIQPDFFIPDKNLFIEVKSRSYNCNGTASEKLDHIVRKYSKLEYTDKYKKSKLLIVCSASEIFEETTRELLDYEKKSSRTYIKEFVKLSKKYNILDWIPLSKLNKYI